MELEGLSMKQSNIVSHIDMLIGNISRMHNEYELTYSLINMYEARDADNIVDILMIEHISDLVSSEFTRYKQ